MAEHSSFPFTVRFFEKRKKTSTLKTAWDCQSCQFANRRKYVYQFHKRMRIALWLAGSNNYKRNARIPLIVIAPGQPKGNSHALVELVDVFPTVCELAGLAVPSSLEGRSFLPLFKKPNRKWKTAVFSQYPRSFEGNRHSRHGDVMGYAIRTNKYRFVQWQNWRTKDVVARELYSLIDDPHEMKNIVNEKGSKLIVARMNKRLGDGWKAALPK